MGNALGRFMAIFGILVFVGVFGFSTLTLANPTNTATEVVDSQTANASADAYDDGVAANEGSTVTNTDNSLEDSQNTATLTATDNSLEDSQNTATFSATDNSLNDSQNTATLTATDNSLEDSQNTATFTATDNSLNDSQNTATDNSLEDSQNTATFTATDNSLEDSQNTDNSTELEDSQNDNSINTDNTNNSTNLADSQNTDSSVSDSNNIIDSNNDSSININDVSIAVADSELSGEITGNSFGFDEDASMSIGGNMIGDGAVSQAAGITVLSQNSGVQSMVQQSVNVQANVNPQ